MWQRMFVLLLVLLNVGTASAQPLGHRAGLVVQYSDGRVETACVLFDEDEISGLELLDRSGIAYIAQQSAVGAAVCKIGNEGCDYPAEGCFCERDGPRAIYWAYQLREGNAWRYSSLGAANMRVGDGDVHGWAWGAGDSAGGAEPPLLDIDTICGPTTAAPSVAPIRASPIAAPATRAPVSAATTAPTVVERAAKTEEPTAWFGYAGFAVIALILVVGTVAAARRRS